MNLPFQHRVRTWILRCFKKKIADDKQERCYRFFEEATELVQSLGMTGEECLRLVWYVYHREVGDPCQEVGGVMVTLHALGCATGINIDHEGEVELARINKPETIKKIREKQKIKPRFLGD